MNRNSNIFDPTKPTLDQRIFKGDIPRPLIVSFIKRKIFSCLRDSFVDDPEKYFTLFLTGSLTTYQYSDASDCDISIFPDYDSLEKIVEEDDPQEIRKMLIYILTSELDGIDLPGTPHPLQNFIQPPGLTPSDLFKTGERSAWDFQNHTWMVPPERTRSHDVITEMPDMFAKAQATAEKMTILLDHGDAEGAKELYKQIHEQRTKDEKAGLGDFSQGNLNYKWLLHEGLFERLNNEAGMHLAKIAKGSEDTEPTGASVGFLHEPHDTLYPPLFDGLKIRPEAAQKLKSHVLDAIAKELDNPDKFIYFTIYGSGISYNWDELGDVDIQMWVDISKYDGEPMEQDDLVAEVRRLLAPVNFTSIKEMGLDLHGCEGTTLIQYYAKPGTGSKEENLASKPYACYDLEKMEWLVKPSKIKPSFYGDSFLHLLPEANSLANEAESLMDDFERHLLEWEFWTDLDKEEKGEGYEMRLKQLQEKAEDEQAGIKRFFDRVFEGRAEAYSPSGKGIEDERDLLQKLLEVWGIFQRLKVDARKTLPWTEEKESSWREASDKESEKIKVIYDFDNDEVILGTTAGKESPRDGIIIGEYDGESVKLFDTAKQWVNANYFKRLWVNSFPTRPIKKVFFDKTEIPTRPTNQMTYLDKLPHLTAKDAWRDGSHWKHFLKNRDVIVKFKIADDSVVEGKIIDWSDDSLKIEVKGGDERTFDNDFLKQIKFQIQDKRTLSANWWGGADLPSDGTFGFINGHLILGGSHHKAIMGSLIENGWTWEQLMNAEQAWGWFNNYNSKNVVLKFVSDSGYQNKKAIEDCIKAFEELFKKRVSLPAINTKGVDSEKDYGTGLYGTEKAQKGTPYVSDLPLPPEQTIAAFKHALELDATGDYFKSQRLPWSGCFGFVNGHLMLNDNHHRAIMATMIDNGWTWEQLLNAKQAWGWFSIEKFLEGYEIQYYLASDSGFQNKDVLEDLTNAFSELYRLKARCTDTEGSSVTDKEGYGTGLRGVKPEIGEGGAGMWENTPVPPPPERQASIKKNSVKWDPNYWHEQGLPSDGCFGFVNGHLVLGKSHHQLIMAKFIDKGWTWEQLMEAEQAWGWFGLQPYEALQYPPHKEQPTSEPPNEYLKSNYVSITFTSDAGYQNEEAIQKAMGAFATMYHLPVRQANVSGTHGVDKNPSKDYGSGLHGIHLVDTYLNNPKYFKSDNYYFRNIPQPPGQDWDPNWEEDNSPPPPLDKPSISDLKSVPLDSIGKEFPEATSAYSIGDGLYLIYYDDGSSLEYNSKTNTTVRIHPIGWRFGMYKEAWTPGGKTKGWGDIMEKATWIRQNNGVTITNNQPQHVTGQVISGTDPENKGPYNTEIWRDDPSSQAITMWDCDCNWDQYAWGRTRQWKKYEGRPCAHVLALFWDALTNPSQDTGGEQTAPPTPVPGGGVTVNQGLIQPVGQPPMNVPLTGPEQLPAPIAPTPAPKPAWSEVVQPGKEEGTVTFPGTFSHWKEADYENPMQVASQYKYGWKPGGLKVWKVDDTTGDPHHFEVLGPNHERYPSGRIYYYGPKKIIHHVWINRGTDYQRDKAAGAVNAWAVQNLNAPISYTKEVWDEGLDHMAALVDSNWKEAEDEIKIIDMSEEMPNLGLVNPEQGKPVIYFPTWKTVFIGGKGNQHYNLIEKLGLKNHWPGFQSNQVEWAEIDNQGIQVKNGSYDDWQKIGAELGLPIWGNFTNNRKEAAFQNGDIVRAWESVNGYAQPAYGQPGYPVTIKKNQSGEVLSSDDETTIAIFPLKTGPLEHHLVKVECPTANLYLDNTNAQPFVKKHSALSHYEALQSLKENGGFSLTANKETANQDGYFVALKDFEEQADTKDLTPESIKSYILSHKSELASDSNVLVGAWLNGDKCYFDLSKKFSDLNEALEFGHENEQLAIWDGINQREIPIVKVSSTDINSLKMFRHIIYDPDLLEIPTLNI